MKTILRLLCLIAGVAALWGCSASKEAVKGASASVESKSLYLQALTALESGNFKIKAEEFYFSENGTSWVKTSEESYVTMQNGRISIHYALDLFPDADQLDRLNIEEHGGIERLQTGRQEVKFLVKIVKTNPSWLNQNLLITLHKGSDKCFVQLDGGPLRFRGYVSISKQ